MEFSINRSQFIRALGMVQNLVERRSSMAILSHVCLIASDDQVTVEATDLEVGFQGVFPCTVIRDGSVSVPARKLYEIARELSSDEVLVRETENKWLSISGNNAVFKLFGLSSDDFPGLPKYKHLKTVEIEAQDLRRMIDCTLFSTASEDTPPYNTSGIYLEKFTKNDSSCLRMVATDGHRLAMIDRPMESVHELDFENGVVISKKGISEMRHLLDESGTVQLGVGSDAGMLMRDSSIVSVRLLVSKYPNYELALPKNESIKLDIPRKPLLDMLRRMHIMTTDRYKGVRLELRSDTLELCLNNPELGDANEQMNVTYRYPELKIGFNPRYFIDALNVMESETVSLGFMDEEHGCSIRGELDEGFMALVMPMQLA